MHLEAPQLIYFALTMMKSFREEIWYLEVQTEIVGDRDDWLEGLIEEKEKKDYIKMLGKTLRLT